MAPQGLPLSFSAAPICENQSFQARMTRLPASLSNMLRRTSRIWRRNEEHRPLSRPTVERSTAWRPSAGHSGVWMEEG
jgi:hypothetical protein